MAHTENNTEALLGSQEQFEALVQEKLRQAVRVALLSILEAEVDAFIGALPYERTEQRRDQRNGHYQRNLETTVGQITDLAVPRTRGGYHTQLFERYHRRRDELDTAIGQMFVDGVSMAKVGQVVETMTGSKRSSIHGLSCVSHLGERVSRVEATPVGRTLCLCLCRWHLLHGDLQRRRL